MQVHEELVRRRIVQKSPSGRKRPTPASTALHRLWFAASAEDFTEESTGAITAANPSSGAASAAWKRPLPMYLATLPQPHRGRATSQRNYRQSAEPDSE